MELASIVTPMFWAGFILFVLAMLALDLFVLGGRTAHKVSAREALGWTGVWVTLSLSFCALLWGWLDGTAGRAVANAKTLEFLTGYLIEQSLSVDNMFVFVMIFSYFAVPAELQRRVLLYGVLGAIVMRAGDDPRRRLAGAAVLLAALRLRRLPGRHRHQDADLRRGINPISKRTRCCAGCADTCASPAVFTASISLCARTASSGRRRCSSCWC
jgi:hypothetical protein